jgi:carboxyl-terminal processing protease
MIVKQTILSFVAAAFLFTASGGTFAAASRHAGSQDPPAAERQDPKAAVGEIVDRAVASDDRQLWALADELVTIGRGKPEREAIRRAMKEAPPRAVLVLARALLQIEKDAYTDDVAAALLKVVEGNTPESQAAATLLGSRLVVLEREDQAKITKQLDDLIAKGNLNGDARLAAALTLYRMGSSEQRTRAMREMREFYKSDDLDRKAAGALALAQCDDVDAVRPFLQKLQTEPTDRGRLARSLLERDDEYRLMSAKLRNASKLDKPERPAEAGKLTADDPRILNEVLDLVAELHVQGNEWKREELLAAAARGMLNALDPHSTFFTAEEYRKMLQELKQVYAGIGAQVRTIGREFTIVRPFFSAPAYRAGIRAGDRVVAIINDSNGVEGEWNTDGQPEDEVIKRLKGTPGTKVKLKVFRRGWVEPRIFPITREIIQIPLLEWDMLPGGIAYFDLLQFGEEVPGQLAAELRKMLKTGDLKGIVLDLRNNPGGFLESATELCSIFLPKGKLACYTEGRGGQRREFFTRHSPVVPENMPLVILVNQYSASASEIVSGCLQDYGRAVIVGETSFGKGSVQQMFELRSLPDEPFKDQDGNRLHDDWEEFTDQNGNGKFDPGPRVKLTIERYYLPKGRSVNTEYDHEQRKVKRGGIEPDILIEWPISDLGREAEIQRIANDEKLVSYVRDHGQSNIELFRQLAASDGKDWNRYPDFESLYKSLNTWLDRNDVRRMLRWKIRDRVAEERGKMFPGYGPQGDVEEDPQLRQALARILSMIGASFADVPEFAGLLKREKEIGVDLGPKSEADLAAAAASRPSRTDSRPSR